MQSIDTNVLVRLLVRDDEEQGRLAEDLFRRALTGGVLITLVVLVETVWILRAAYGFDRHDIVFVLRKLLVTEGVTVDAGDVVRLALSGFESGSADFADYVILESARRSAALPLWTFDQRLANAEGARQVA